MRKKLFFKSCGARLCGILNAPKKGKLKEFCMVFCHGWTSSKKSSKITELQKRLAKKGVSSFAFDFFGHGESAGDIREITQSIAVDNIKDAVNFLRKKGYKRFGLYGSSFGGGTAIAYAAKHNGLEFLCLLVPVTGWNSIRFRKRRDAMGIRLGFWNDAIKYDFFKLAFRIRVNTLIVQGTKDKSTPLRGAKKLFRSLGGDRMMVVVPGADHYFRNSKHFNSALNAFENFILYLLSKKRQ